MPQQNEALDTLPLQRFNKIYERTFDILFAFVSKNTKESSAVMDVLQETYLRLWKHMDSVKDDEKILPLLRTYATNILINLLQKQQREQQHSLQYIKSRPSIQEGEVSLQEKENHRQLKAIIDSFPPQRKEVYRLKREMGLTHQQISEKLDISVHTIDRHINAAMKVLKSKLLSQILLAAMISAQ